MEIEVTHMVEELDEMPMLSGSVAELGSDAGPRTWKRSVEYGRTHPLLKTDDERDAARHHFRGYGAWTREEIDAWSEDELQGIVCQDVAAAIREMESYETYEDFQQAAEQGRVSGRLYMAGQEDGSERWYFYVGE
jgi:hypothetical protein